jgi:hypothetical protein
MLPQQPVVGMKSEGAPRPGSDAPPPEQATTAGRAEGHLSGARDRPGHVGRAGNGAGGLVDDGVVESEPAATTVSRNIAVERVTGIEPAQSAWKGGFPSSVFLVNAE